MGAIIDIVHLDQEDLPIITNRFPACNVTALPPKDKAISKYRIIIPNYDSSDDNYYRFLVENGIALSSRNFLNRIASDHRFADGMKVWILEYIREKNKNCAFNHTPNEDSTPAVSTL